MRIQILLFYILLNNSQALLSKKSVKFLREGRCGISDDRAPLAFTANRQWNKKDFTWKVVDGYMPPMGLGRVRATLYESFADWARYAPLTFREVSPYDEADIEIAFIHRYHDELRRFDGPGGVLAYAYGPPVGKLYFEIEEDWIEEYIHDGISFNLRLVATHEIGHILGLGHSHDPSAIMYSQYHLIKPHDILPRDDQNGIQAMYGVRYPSSGFFPTSTHTTATTTRKPLTYNPNTTRRAWWEIFTVSTTNPWARFTTTKSTTKRTTPRFTTKRTTTKSTAKRTTPRFTTKRTTTKSAAKRTTAKFTTKRTTPRFTTKRTTAKFTTKRTTSTTNWWARFTIKTTTAKPSTTTKRTSITTTKRTSIPSTKRTPTTTMKRTPTTTTKRTAITTTKRTPIATTKLSTRRSPVTISTTTKRSTIATNWWDRFIRKTITTQLSTRKTPVTTTTTKTTKTSTRKFPVTTRKTTTLSRDDIKKVIMRVNIAPTRSRSTKITTKIPDDAIRRVILTVDTVPTPKMRKPIFAKLSQSPTSKPKTSLLMTKLTKNPVTKAKVTQKPTTKKKTSKYVSNT